MCLRQNYADMIHAVRTLPKFHPMSDVSRLFTFRKTHTGCVDGPLTLPCHGERHWGGVLKEACSSPTQQRAGEARRRRLAFCSAVPLKPRDLRNVLMSVWTDRGEKRQG